MYGSAYGPCCSRSALEPSFSIKEAPTTTARNNGPWSTHLFVTQEFEAFLDWFSFLSLVYSDLSVTNFLINEARFLPYSRRRTYVYIRILGNGVLSELLAWPGGVSTLYTAQLEQSLQAFFRVGLRLQCQDWGTFVSPSWVQLLLLITIFFNFKASSLRDS